MLMGRFEIEKKSAKKNSRRGIHQAHEKKRRYSDRYPKLCVFTYIAILPLNVILFQKFR